MTLFIYFQKSFIYFQKSFIYFQKSFIYFRKSFPGLYIKGGGEEHSPLNRPTKSKKSNESEKKLRMISRIKWVLGPFISGNSAGIPELGFSRISCYRSSHHNSRDSRLETMTMPTIYSLPYDILYDILLSSATKQDRRGVDASPLDQ